MRIARTSAGLAGAALVGYHSWLLAGQVADGRLAEPWVLARWLVAAGLVTGLIALRRSGESLWSRKAVAIWVLAALLHGPAVAADAGRTLNGPALPEAVATVVLQVVSASGTLVFGLWLLASLLAARDRRVSPRGRLVPVLVPRAVRSVGVASRFSPRPPPIA